MAPETTTPKARRTVKRLSPAERKQKAAENVGANIAKASTLLINVADGFMAAGNRSAARRTLDLWSQLVDVDAEPAAENGEQAYT